MIAVQPLRQGFVQRLAEVLWILREGLSQLFWIRWARCSKNSLPDKSAGRIKGTPKYRSVFFWWFQSVCFKECLIYIAKHGMMTFGIFSQGGVEPHFLTSISPDYDGDPICQEDQEVTVQVEGAKKKHMCPQMSQCLNSFCQSSSFDCFWSLHIYIYTYYTFIFRQTSHKLQSPRDRKVGNPEMMVKTSSPSWTKSIFSAILVDEVGSQVPGGECRGRPRDLEGNWGFTDRLEDAPNRRRGTRGNDDKP